MGKHRHPQAGGYERLYGAIVVRPVGDARLEAGALATVQEYALVGADAADPGLLRQLAEPERGAPRKSVPVRQQELEGLIEEVDALQLHLGLGQGFMLVDQAEVELPAGEAPDHALQIVFDNAHSDVGVSLGEDHKRARNYGRQGG
jgi:hypothetical protein